MLQKTKYIFLGIFLAALGLWGLAVTIPNSFSSGDVVSAAKMNQNFQALKAAVDQLESKVTDLETTTTALQTEQDGLPTRQGFPRAYAFINGDATVEHQFSTTGATISVSRPSSGSPVGRFIVDFGDEDIDLGDAISITPILPGVGCSAIPWTSNNLLVVCQQYTTGNNFNTGFWVVLFNDGS